MTIRSRLVWLTLGLTVPLMLVGFYNLWGFWQVSRSQRTDSLAQQAELAANAFEQRLIAYRQTLETVSTLVREGQPDLTVKEYLESIVKTRPEWLDVRIVSSDGHTLISGTRKSIDADDVSAAAISRIAAGKNSFVVSADQEDGRNFRLFSIAAPVGNRTFVVARINGADISRVFDDLALPPDGIIAVFGPDNEILYRSRASTEQMSLDVGEAAFFDALNEKREGTIEIESPFDGVRRVYGLARVETADSVVAVSLPIERLIEPIRDQFVRQLILSVSIAILAIFAAILISRSIARPIRRLAIAARAFGGGDLTARAEVTQSGSIRELGVNFNHMADEIAQREEKLETLDRMKSEFVGNVSHELRTPLTTIKTLVSVLQRSDVSELDRFDHLRTIAEECDRQISFVQNLLDLSRLESPNVFSSPIPVDICEIINEVVAAHLHTAKERNVSLVIELPKLDLPRAMADVQTLRRVISNLVENALKYTGSGGEVVVSANAQDKRVTLSVSDNGCGINSADMPHIFEKFFRAKPLKERHRAGLTDEPDADDNHSFVDHAPGVGLGLYVVQNLVEQIGGEISAESPVDSTGCGTRVTVFMQAEITTKE